MTRLALRKSITWLKIAETQVLQAIIAAVRYSLISSEGYSVLSEVDILSLAIS